MKFATFEPNGVFAQEPVKQLCVPPIYVCILETPRSLSRSLRVPQESYYGNILHHGIILQTCIMDLYYGLQLRTHISEVYYGIILWNHGTIIHVLRNDITQLYYGVVLWFISWHSLTQSYYEVILRIHPHEKDHGYLRRVPGVLWDRRRPPRHPLVTPPGPSRDPHGPQELRNLNKCPAPEALDCPC